jgi:hypothetical protein
MEMAANMRGFQNVEASIRKTGDLDEIFTNIVHKFVHSIYMVLRHLILMGKTHVISN